VSDLVARGPGAIVAELPLPAELVRTVAAKLVHAGRDALLCSTEGDGTFAILMRADGSALDCGSLWKRIAGQVGGRGGGRAERAEGRLAVRVSDWAGLVGSLLS
jgi:alanyl-tRNA synthetase